MRASKTEQTGGAGVSEVTANFQRISWGVAPNDAHDLGTDLFVWARDQRGFDRGLIVGVQVKSGPTWFKKEERSENGTLKGWWYYEGGTSHFDDWVTHGLPHLLVLRSLEESISYWVQVTADGVIGTGKGCKILVPCTQTIVDSQVDKLLEVAADQKAAPRLEGSSFDASATAVPPGRRLRYALLAPRLVAPHRNVGQESVITPEEAIALCAQGRFWDLQLFSQAHNQVPDPSQPYGGTNWRWSLVHAFWTWFFDNDIDSLKNAVEESPDGEGRAAAGVLLVCAYLRVEQLADARSLLDELIETDELGPVDHAWSLVQRARIRADIGDVSGARSDAAQAQRQFPGDRDDVTVSAVAAAAAWLLFRTAESSAEDLSFTMRAADTAIAWWRSQTLVSALNEAANETFRTWSQDTANRWSAEDSETLNLFAAELNADLSGEHAVWCGLAALSARQMLRRAHQTDDEEDLIRAVDALRRSGDHDSLKKALRHLRRVGPITALEDAVRRIPPDDWTHTTALANLKALATTGDLADETMADEWIEMLVRVLIDSSEFENRVQPSFLVNLAAIEAIGGLLPAASPMARRSAAEYLASLDGSVNDVLVPGLTNWLDELRPEEMTGPVSEGLRELADTEQGALGAKALGVLAELGDQAAKQEIVERSLAGNLNALSAMADVTALSTEQASTLIENFEARIYVKIEKAERSSWGIGGFDPGYILALFNIYFPEIARWDPVLDLLTDTAVLPDNKRGALRLIFELHDQISDIVRNRLARNLSAIATTQDFPELGTPQLGGLTTALGIALGAITDNAADIAVAQLAFGTEQDRCDAAALLGRGWCERMRPLLASFVGDVRINVREVAAHAIGRLAASDADPVILELATRLAHDRGVIVPATLLVGMSRVDASTELGREIATSLDSHASGRVRRLAREFLELDA